MILHKLKLLALTTLITVTSMLALPPLNAAAEDPPAPGTIETWMTFPNNIESITTDLDDNVYVVVEAQILKIDPLKTVTVFAGTGERSFSGDGGPATAATIGYNCHIDMGENGCLYIADTENYRIRMIDPAGIITTIAGTGMGSYSGIGKPALLSAINPHDICYAGGVIYFSDQLNHSVFKIDRDGYFTIVAGSLAPGYTGNGWAVTARLNLPYDIDTDGQGNLYIADSVNQRIERVTPFGVLMSVTGTDFYEGLGDAGYATDANLENPQGIYVDQTGVFYIADPGQKRIRKVAKARISTIAGNGESFNNEEGVPATEAGLNAPTSITVDGSGNLLIVDETRIRKVFSLQETIPPSVTINFTPGDVYSPATMPLTITGTIADDPDGSGIAPDNLWLSVQRQGGQYWNGSDWQFGETWLTATNPAAEGSTPATWESNCTLPWWDNGTYTVRVKGYDALEVTPAYTSVSFTFDNRPPTVRILNPGENDVLKGGSTATIEWTTDGAQSITISYFDGIALGIIADGEPDDGSFDWQVPVTNGSSGFIRISARDAAGYTSSVSSPAFRIDSTPPSITIDTMPGRLNKYFVITGSYTERSDTVMISLYNADTGTYWNGSAEVIQETWLKAPVNKENDEWLFPVPELQPENSYVITVITIDEAGNQSPYAFNAFTFQEVTAPAKPGDANGDGTVNVLDMTEIVRMILGYPPYDQ